MTTARLERRDGGFRLVGPLTAAGVAAVWSGALALVRNGKGPLAVDLTDAQPIDTAGITLLLAIERARSDVTFHGLSTQAQNLLDRLRDLAPGDVPAAPAHTANPGLALRETLGSRIAFVGETVLAGLALRRRRRFLRAGNFFHLAERAGTQAVPLVLMMGFLIGMILAFQSAIPMRQFGADIYVAPLVAISLFRELGPLLAAIILAGRTGSAFAAELGTMKVNEEIDALVTMGIDPQVMLVLPRMAAAMSVVPALALGIDAAGLLGMGFVMRILGFPPSAVIGQIQSATGPHDLFLGLAKSIVFGAAVGMIGCRAGLTTGAGPRAVGEAATSAVVGGIVAIILLDGFFAVLFYRLGL